MTRVRAGYGYLTTCPNNEARCMMVVVVRWKSPYTLVYRKCKFSIHELASFSCSWPPLLYDSYNLYLIGSYALNLDGSQEFGSTLTRFIHFPRAFIFCYTMIHN